MKIIKNVIILFMMIYPLLAATNQDWPKEPITGKIKLIQVWIDELIDYYKIPGLTIAIVHDQQLVWADGFGYKDLDKQVMMNSKDLFRIASISKLFTSTAIMQLRDQGQLRLDDPVKQYLVWFNIKNSYEGAPQVTIRHILTHTSGMPREAAFPYWTNNEFPTLQEIIETLPEQEMIFPPETKWKYSNLAMALLGEIVVSASGLPYEEYINTNILQPLHMNETSVYPDQQDLQNLATGYRRNRGLQNREEAEFLDSKGITPAANLTSNVHDLAKFMSLQFRYDGRQDQQILKGSTLKEMHRIHWLRPSWTSGWGLGFGISKDGDHVYVGHNGWVDGYRSSLLFIPQEKVGAIVMINTDDYSPWSIAKRVIKIIYPELTNDIIEEKTMIDKRWSLYEGKYIDTSHWRTNVMLLNDKLYLYNFSYPPANDPEENLVRLYPVDGKEHIFRMTGPNGNGETVVFQLDDQSNVIKIKTGENYIYPLKSE